MSDSNYIKLYTGSFIIVQKLKIELEHINISPVIKDETESGRLAGFGSSIQNQQELFVHKDEFAKSKKVLENVISEFE